MLYENFNLSVKACGSQIYWKYKVHLLIAEEKFDLTSVLLVSTYSSM